MKFLTIVTILSLLAGCSNQIDHTSNPRIDSLVPFYSAHVMARQVDIWLPRQYQSRPGQRFPVLYMHDGQSLFSHASAPLGIAWDLDATAQRLIDQGKIKPAIIVAIWSTPRRALEYFPAPVTSYFSDPDQIAIDGAKQYLSHYPADEYLQFVVRELKPYLDNNYRTLPDKNNTSVVGSAMGALISLYALTEYPDVFGNAACLSTYWSLLFNNDNSSLQSVWRYMEDNLPSAGSHRLYFDTPAMNPFYDSHQQQMDKILQAKNYEQGQDWITEKIPGAERDENSWQVRGDQMLEFF